MFNKVLIRLCIVQLRYYFCSQLQMATKERLPKELSSVSGYNDGSGPPPPPVPIK
jgi:hypothetical protein